jgi:5-formyltetrahydrofolate cyclo-ligase
MQSQARRSMRQTVRARRQGLSALDQTLASEDILQHIKSLPAISRAKTVGIYLSADGEIDTHAIIDYLWQQGKTVCLPVLHPFSKGQLLFLRYGHDTPMVENRFNIQEPRLDQRLIIPVAQLDLLFTPLVAFDETGQRLGMGGGYYDRTLESWYHTGHGPEPVGVAHDCQQVDAVPVEPWDVPLPTVITPSRIWQNPLQHDQE